MFEICFYFIAMFYLYNISLCLYLQALCVSPYSMTAKWLPSLFLVSGPCWPDISTNTQYWLQSVNQNNLKNP